MKFIFTLTKCKAKKMKYANESRENFFHKIVFPVEKNQYTLRHTEGTLRCEISERKFSNLKL